MIIHHPIFTLILPSLKTYVNVCTLQVGFGMATKQQLIKTALGGYFLQGVVDMQEAFRAIEITNPQLTAPSGAPCEGLRTLEKICYNLLDKQVG